MKVLVLGASGGTGRELVRQGLAQGHAVTAFVRNPAKFEVQHANVRIEQGDVADRALVEDAVRGHDAAICALGASSLLRRDPALDVGMHNIVVAMEQAGVRRMVYLSPDTVRTARDQLRRYVIVPLVLRNTAADHEVDEGIIKQSHLDWIIVRPPMLNNGESAPASSEAASALRLSPLSQQSRAPTWQSSC